MNWEILYNPFGVLGRRDGFLVGLLVVVLLTAVVYWGGAHLDGALDLHVYSSLPSLPLVIIESLVSWLSLALCFFAVSRLFGGNGGLISHMAATGLARFPYIISAVIVSRPVIGDLMRKGVVEKAGEITVRTQVMMLPAIIIGGLAIVALSVWAIVMLYFGYREASRTEGGKCTASFIIGLVVAELITKLIIYFAVRGGI